MELTNNLGEVTGNIRRIGHSRIPVYEETLDRIAGIFYVKDLMRWLAGENRSGEELRPQAHPAAGDLCARDQDHPRTAGGTDREESPHGDRGR